MQSVSHPLTVISVVQRIFFWTEDTLNEDLLKILCSISLKEGDKKFFLCFFFYGMEQFWHCRVRQEIPSSFKHTAHTLKYLEGFIKEPDEFRQISVPELNVPFIKILCKVFRDGLAR